MATPGGTTTAPRPGRRPARRSLALLAVVGLTLGATACGASSGSSGSAEGPGSEGGGDDATEIPAGSGRTTTDDPAPGPQARVEEGDPYDHWHASFAVDVCGVQQEALVDDGADVDGIHTHGDGLIHIHPFSTRVDGEDATLSRFFRQVGLEVTDEGFTTPAGKAYVAGETTCGGEATEVVLAHWTDAATALSSPPDQVFTSDVGDVRFLEDLGAYTLALQPVGTPDDEIQAPAASAKIEELGAADGG